MNKSQVQGFDKILVTDIHRDCINYLCITSCNNSNTKTRMVVGTSDSCNTLVSLRNNNNKQVSVDEFRGEVQEYAKTELHLPRDDFIVGNEQELEQPIYLPLSGRVDHYLKNVPRVMEACDELLANPPKHFTDNSSERVLYVAQGEVAHAVQLQCDVIVSDKATTCHILAFRSESADSMPLSSLAHIDGPSYESCIRSMLSEHIAHHRSCDGEEKKSDFAAFYDRISLDIHILGGFEDADSTSSGISNWLMNLLAKIAHEERDFIRMTLKTCAITSINDNGYACPIGRGLGIDLRTGKAFLSKVDEEVAGPASQLRSVRLWSGSRTLSIIHTSKSNDVRIHPFAYKSFPEVSQLLQLPDFVMLRFTSTSPDVEEPNFCTLARSTLRFLLDVECTRVFGPSIDQPLIFRRTGSSNSWKRTR